MNKKITLQLADGELVYDDIDLFKSSTLIQSFLDQEDEDSEENVVIPLLNITRERFLKIVSFLEHHKNNPMAPMMYTRPPKDEWDMKFVQSISSPQLLLIVEDANFLGINDLIHLLASTIASRIERKTKQEICMDFEIQEPKQEEINAFIEKNKWAEFT